jgi:hypothetical protein
VTDAIRITPNIVAVGDDGDLSSRHPQALLADGATQCVAPIYVDYIRPLCVLQQIPPQWCMRDRNTEARQTAGQCPLVGIEGVPWKVDGSYSLCDSPPARCTAISSNVSPGNGGGTSFVRLSKRY